ncbi:hypothetical protein [Halopiger goleimassiliensis]|uniref:hypothetical protein n=1 Tax=Halopiger goleimassiliensis TaxID=1293048 RepID=UPI000677D7D2|nr:hypothetical protein [Halopiger goleimassiliensis]
MAPDSASVPATGADVETNEEASGNGRASDETGRLHHPLEEETDDGEPDEYACPLCGFTHEARDTVFSHLLAAHPKQAIGSVLLEQQTLRETE